jgi:hypothetical protein
LPVDLTRARIVIHVVGPMGRLEVSAFRSRDSGGDGAANAPREVVSLKTFDDPVGTLQAIELTDRELLALDADGGFMLGLTAGELEGSAMAPRRDLSRESQSWRIEQLSLELSGVVSP